MYNKNIFLKYRSYFLIALLLHLLIIIFFVMHPTSHAFGDRQRQASSTQTQLETEKAQQLAQREQVISARSLSSKQVDAEVKAIKAERKSRLKQQQRQLNRLRASTQKAQRQRRRQKAALTKLQQQQRQAKLQLAQNKRLLQKQKTQLAQSQRQAAAAKTAAKKAAEAKAVAAKQAALAAQKKAAEASRLQKLRQAKQLQGVLSKYKGRILAAISRQWIVPANLDKNLACELLIRLAPGGKVISVDLVKSSGNTLLDRSAKLAVLKASPLPVPGDQSLFEAFREVKLTVRPEDLIHS